MIVDPVQIQEAIALRAVQVANQAWYASYNHYYDVIWEAVQENNWKARLARMDRAMLEGYSAMKEYYEG